MDATAATRHRWVNTLTGMIGWGIGLLSVVMVVVELAGDGAPAHLIEGAALLAAGIAVATHARRPALSRAMALPVMAFGVLEIVLAAAHLDAEADVPVGVALIAFGVARQWSGASTRRGRWVGDLGAAVFASVVLTITLGFVFAGSLSDADDNHLQASAGAAGLLVLALLGLMACRSDRLPVSLLLSTGPAGTLTRRLLPAVILAPPLLVRFHQVVDRQDRVQPELSLAVLTGGMIVVLAWVVGVTAARVQDAETARIRATREIEAVFTSMPAVVTLTDPDGTIIRVSDYAAQVMLPDGGDLTGLNAVDFYPRRIRADVIAQGEQALVDGTTTTNEYDTVFGGRRRTWELTRFPVADASGNRIGVGSFGLDVTARKNAEVAASAASLRFRSYLDAAPDATIMVDRDGVIQYANARVLDLLGHEPESLIGRNVDELVPDVIRPGHAQVRSSYMAHPRHRAMGSGKELLALRKDGSTIPVEISLGPVETESGTWIAAALRDVTDRRAAEAALRDAEQRALHLADHDPLTGVTNRRRLELDLAGHLAAPVVDEGGLLIIDVDHFKRVNDTAGHSIGDLLLVEVARVVGQCLPPGGVLSRLGGDEFAVLLTHGDAAEIRRVAEVSVTAVRDLAHPGGEVAAVQPTVSIGAAPFTSLPRAERTSKGALVHADDALYAAKAGGRDQAVLWTPEVVRERGPSRAAIVDRSGHRQPDTRSQGD